MNVVSPEKKWGKHPFHCEPYPLDRQSKVKGTQTSACLLKIWSTQVKHFCFLYVTRESKTSSVAAVCVCATEQRTWKGKKRIQGYTSLSYYTLEWKWNNCSNYTDQNDLINCTNMSLIVLNLSNEQVSAALKFKRHCVSPKLIYIADSKHICY